MKVKQRRDVCMTKKQRLAKLLKAAEDLQYIPRGYRRFKHKQKFSCNAVSIRVDGSYSDLGERVAYDIAVAANESSQDLIGNYDEQSQLARQLAVLMYREGIERGKYE